MRFDEINLDSHLIKLCGMVQRNLDSSDKKPGLVAACVMANGKTVYKTSSYSGDGLYKHAERMAIEAFESKYGELPKNATIVTTLSPCSEQGDETADHRVGTSCEDLLNDKQVKYVYCGYMDPTQDEGGNQFKLAQTSNDKIQAVCKHYASMFLE
jgi:pyrimidine deaminase RibD-like protein